MRRLLVAVVLALAATATAESAQPLLTKPEVVHAFARQRISLRVVTVNGVPRSLFSGPLPAGYAVTVLVDPNDASARRDYDSASAYAKATGDFPVTLLRNIVISCEPIAR